MNKYDSYYESQYNLKPYLPDLETYFERMRRESEVARSALPYLLDQQYGDGPNMSLDIFPHTGALNPILIFIHGGYWRGVMDKDMSAFPAIGLNEAGVVYISVNYALATAISLDEIIEQCRQAVMWVHQNAKTHGGDPERIHICGHSAGGHFAAMMLSTDWAQRGAAEFKLAGGIAISGIFDLVPLVETSLNDPIQLDRAAARRNSATECLPSNGPPLIAAVGTAETDDFVRQSREYAEAWNEHGGSALYLPLEGFHHFNVVFELGRTGSELNDAVLAQIGV